MAPSFLFSLSIIAIMQSAVIQQNVDCYNAKGPPSSSSNSFVGCSSGYTITSCGVIANNANNALGSFIDSNQCRAVGDHSSNTLSAQARCCNLTNYGTSFHYYLSTESPSSGDAQATYSCELSTEQLIGCFGYDHEYTKDNNYFDGIFSGKHAASATPLQTISTNNTCTAQNGDNNNDGGAYVGAICYDESTIVDGYKLECVSIWSEFVSDSDISSISCPIDGNKWFMASCMGHSYWGIKDYYIENDICYTHRNLPQGAQSNAICCKMEKETTEVPMTEPPQSTLAAAESTLKTSDAITTESTHEGIPTASPSSAHHEGRIYDNTDIEETNDKPIPITKSRGNNILYAAAAVCIIVLTAFICYLLWHRQKTKANQHLKMVNMSSFENDMKVTRIPNDIDSLNDMEIMNGITAGHQDNEIVNVISLEQEGYDDDDVINDINNNVITKGGDIITIR